MTKLRHLTSVDYATIAGNFTTVQTYMDGSATAINGLLSRVAAVEVMEGGLASWATGVNSTISGNASSITSLAARATALETWRNAKHAASANISTSYNLPTVAIVGLLSTVTKAGVEAALSGLAAEINNLKQIMRDREILA